MRKAGARPVFQWLMTAALIGMFAVPLHAQSVDELEKRKSVSEAEYLQLFEKLSLSQEKVSKLEAEVNGIRKEKAVLTAALIQSAKTEKKLSEDIQDIEARLADLKTQRDTISNSLRERRNVLSEVLAGLQRIGLNPPPALLVRPDDALASVRSAILLSAVVPEMRAETEILFADLKELRRVATGIASERENLTIRVEEQKTERQRLALLVDEKRKLEASSGAILEREQSAAQRLAEEAGSLQQLITSLDARITTIRETVEAARRDELEKLESGRNRAEKNDPSSLKIGSIYAFASLRGRMDLPVTGQILHRFGETDDIGRRYQGDTVQTQSGAIVTAPSDSEVLYAGPFRSYGQLLILDAKDGYHVVLAGMDRISVRLGQAVLAGEPVGVMGEARVAAVGSSNDGNTVPELYVEFRKGGKPVNPASWWTPESRGRTGNDS